TMIMKRNHKLKYFSLALAGLLFGTVSCELDAPLENQQIVEGTDYTQSQNMVLLLRGARSEEHTSELQSRENLVCRLLLVKNYTATTLPARSAGVRTLSSPACTTMN